MDFGHPTFRDVRELAHRLWDTAGCPPADQVSPDYFWLEAERQLTPAVILVISQELQQFGICRRPGDGFFADFYYRHDETATWGNPPTLLPCAFGTLRDNGVYEVQSHHDARNRQFDLNCEAGLEGLIEYLKLAAATKHAPKITFTDHAMTVSLQPQMIGNLLKCIQTAKQS